MLVDLERRRFGIRNSSHTKCSISVIGDMGETLGPNAKMKSSLIRTVESEYDLSPFFVPLWFPIYSIFSIRSQMNQKTENCTLMDLCRCSRRFVFAFM